jgi:hypothetical protein
MTGKDKNRTITISFSEFQEISTDVAAKLCAILDDPKLPVFSALLLAKITTELFTNEELIIDEEGE